MQAYLTSLFNSKSIITAIWIVAILATPMSLTATTIPNLKIEISNSYDLDCGADTCPVREKSEKHVLSPQLIQSWSKFLVTMASIVTIRVANQVFGFDYALITEKNYLSILDTANAYLHYLIVLYSVEIFNTVFNSICYPENYDYGIQCVFELIKFRILDIIFIKYNKDFTNSETIYRGNDLKYTGHFEGARFVSSSIPIKYIIEAATILTRDTAHSIYPKENVIEDKTHVSGHVNPYLIIDLLSVIILDLLVLNKNSLFGYFPFMPFMNFNRQGEIRVASAFGVGLQYAYHKLVKDFFRTKLIENNGLDDNTAERNAIYFADAMALGDIIIRGTLLWSIGFNTITKVYLTSSIFNRAEAIVVMDPSFCQLISPKMYEYWRNYIFSTSPDDDSTSIGWMLIMTSLQHSAYWLFFNFLGKVFLNMERPIIGESFIIMGNAAILSWILYHFMPNTSGIFANHFEAVVNYGSNMFWGDK